MKIITEKEIIRQRKRKARIDRIKNVDWGLVCGVISTICWWIVIILMIIKAAMGNFSVTF